MAGTAIASSTGSVTASGSMDTSIRISFRATTRCSSPGWPSRSSPGSTSPAVSACASRTSPRSVPVDARSRSTPRTTRSRACADAFCAGRSRGRCRAGLRVHDLDRAARHTVRRPRDHAARRARRRVLRCASRRAGGGPVAVRGRGHLRDGLVPDRSDPAERGRAAQRARPRRLGVPTRVRDRPVRGRDCARGLGRYRDQGPAARMAMTRLLAAVVATTTGLAFWWGLTEPLPVPPAILLGVPAAILLCSGVIAGRLGAVAAPCALLFSLLLGSILATQLHQAFTPSFPPVSRFGGWLALELPALLAPLALSGVLGAIGGFAGERLLPTPR